VGELVVGEVNGADPRRRHHENARPDERTPADEIAEAAIAAMGAEHDKDAEDEPSNAAPPRDGDKGNHGAVTLAAGHAEKAQDGIGREARREPAENGPSNPGEDRKEIGQDGLGTGLGHAPLLNLAQTGGGGV
jgi:hypothetical protein